MKKSLLYLLALGMLATACSDNGVSTSGSEEVGMVELNLNAKLQVSTENDTKVSLNPTSGAIAWLVEGRDNHAHGVVSGQMTTYDMKGNTQGQTTGDLTVFTGTVPDYTANPYDFYILYPQIEEVIKPIESNCINIHYPFDDMFSVDLSMEPEVVTSDFGMEVPIVSVPLELTPTNIANLSDPNSSTRLLFFSMFSMLSVRVAENYANLSELKDILFDKVVTTATATNGDVFPSDIVFDMNTMNRTSDLWFTVDRTIPEDATMTDVLSSTFTYSSPTTLKERLNDPIAGGDYAVAVIAPPTDEIVEGIELMMEFYNGEQLQATIKRTAPKDIIPSTFEPGAFYPINVGYNDTKVTVTVY